MRALVTTILMLGCGGEASDATDAPDRADPWAGDVLIGSGELVDGAEVSQVQWFGFADDDTPWVVVERRDELRPLGTALVRLEGSPRIVVDSAELFETTGSDGLVELHMDATGTASFATADERCWGRFAEDALITICLDALAFDVDVAYLGPMVAGRRPAVLTEPGRIGYRIAVWDGEVDRWYRAGPGELPVGVWALDATPQLWMALDGVLKTVTPDARTEVARVGTLVDTTDASPGSLQIRGLTRSHSNGSLAFVASAVQGSTPLAGTGIYTLVNGTPTLRVDLAQPLVGDAGLAFLGTGGEPGFTWAFDPRTDRVVFVGELDDGTTGVFREQAEGWSAAARSGEVATDRYGEPMPGVTWLAIGSGVVGPDGSVVFTGVLDGDGVVADNRYGVWVARPDGGVWMLARTGEPVPGSTESVERIRLHGARLVFPDPRDEDPARRRGVPDAGGDNDVTGVMWGAPGWNRSIDEEAGCTSVLLALEGEETDVALVRRRVGDCPGD